MSKKRCQRRGVKEEVVSPHNENQWTGEHNLTRHIILGSVGVKRLETSKRDTMGSLGTGSSTGELTLTRSEGHWRFTLCLPKEMPSLISVGFTKISDFS